MGFTMYWTRPERVIPFEKFLEAAKTCKKVCDVAGIDIRMEFDSAEPAIFTKDTIRFNGHGEEGCETFLVKRTDAEEGDCCKTERRPYSICVGACLVILRDQLGFEIQSDDRNQKEGLSGFEAHEELVKTALNPKKKERQDAGTD